MRTRSHSPTPTQRPQYPTPPPLDRSGFATIPGRNHACEGPARLHSPRDAGLQFHAHTHGPGACRSSRAPEQELSLSTSSAAPPPPGPARGAPCRTSSWPRAVRSGVVTLPADPLAMPAAADAGAMASTSLQMVPRTSTSSSQTSQRHPGYRSYPVRQPGSRTITSPLVPVISQSGPSPTRFDRKDRRVLLHCSTPAYRDLAEGQTGRQRDRVRRPGARRPTWSRSATARLQPEPDPDAFTGWTKVRVRSFSSARHRQPAR